MALKIQKSEIILIYYEKKNAWGKKYLMRLTYEPFEEKIREYVDIEIETIQNETQRRKWKQTNLCGISMLWYKFK